VLPLAIDTIRVAEAIRRAAMSQFGNWCRRNEDRAGEYRRQDSPGQFASPVLSGKDDAGTILCAHRHAHYLPTCETPDRHRLTHVTIFARDGLSDGEVAALSSIRDVNMGGDISLRVQLTGVGDLSQFGGPIFQTASEWYSLTPFLGPAHIGRNRQERYLRKALRKEWRRLAEQIDEFRDVQLEEVTPLAIDDPSWISRPRPYEFRRSRTKHLGEKYRPVGIFRLRFSRPIPGPLTLGYASHFGLGLFEAAGDAHGDTTEGGV
jgi:CRISPR-associated protein Csb2